MLNQEALQTAISAWFDSNFPRENLPTVKNYDYFRQGLIDSLVQSINLIS